MTAAAAMTLESISDRRANAILEIPLEEAIDKVRRAALDVEMRHSNEILRIIHELEKPTVSRSERLPTFVQLFDPNVPDAYRLHVADPRTDERKTFCGVSYVGWKNIGVISTRADLSEQGDLCRRCRHSLELAMQRGA